MSASPSNVQRERRMPPGHGKTVHFEATFDLIGHFGCFQASLYLISCIIEVCASLSISFFVFEYAVPGWTCSAVTARNRSLLSNALNISSRGHEIVRNGPSYVNRSFNITLNVCPSDTLRCDNLTFLNDFTSISTEWNFICDRRYLGRLTASLYFLGVLIGTCICGHLADVFGRKKVTLAIWLLLILFQTMTGFSPAWKVYLPLRILAGAFTGGCTTVALILPMEYLGPKYRILASNRIGWQLGGILLSVVGYLVRDWHYLAFAAGLLTLPFVPVFIIFVPESARWLMQRGRIDEARFWLKKIAKYNGKPEPDLSLLEKVVESENADRRAMEQYSYLDLFRTRKYALRTSALMLGWFDMSLIAYGITADIEQLTGNIYLNVALSHIIVLVVRWISVPMANRIGRRKTYLLFKVGLLVSFVVVMTLVIIDAAAYGRIITGLVLSTFLWQAGVANIIFMYCSEAYPTLLRSRSSAVANASARVAGILAPQVGLLTYFHISAPYVIYLIVGILSLIYFYLVMPETSNQPLPEGLPPREPRTTRVKGRDMECEENELTEPCADKDYSS